MVNARSMAGSQCSSVNRNTSFDFATPLFVDQRWQDSTIIQGLDSVASVKDFDTETRSRSVRKLARTALMIGPLF